jgi:excisionase family DNA binding protein
MSTDSHGKVYAPKDIPVLFGGRIGRNYVYEMIRDGRLRSIKIGSRYFIPQSAVEELFRGDFEPKPPRSNEG